MKLYIWGTGCGAGDLADHGLDVSGVCAFLDSAPVSDSFLGRPVERPEAINPEDIDLILVASRHVEAIAQKAAELGIAADKLVFLRNNWQLTDRNRDYAAAEKILSADYLDSVRRPQHTVRDPLWVQDSPLTPRDLENDYVRMRTLEALCRELGNVPGAAAELGVYRGGFARCLNALLPERTLYLFDRSGRFTSSTPLRALTARRHWEKLRVSCRPIETPGRNKSCASCRTRRRSSSNRGFSRRVLAAWRSALRWCRWTWIWRRVRLRGSGGSIRA